MVQVEGRQGSGRAVTVAAAPPGTASGPRVDLDSALGYLLKQVAVALRGEMDVVLRPLGLTVAQYACLELLAQRPGLSNSELARGTFVSRQAMNMVLQGLERAGLVRRVDAPRSGRSRPGRLTTRGDRVLARASGAVTDVQARMCSPLAPAEQDELRRLLRACLAGLTED